MIICFETQQFPQRMRKYRSVSFERSRDMQTLFVFRSQRSHPLPAQSLTAHHPTHSIQFSEDNHFHFGNLWNNATVPFDSVFHSISTLSTSSMTSSVTSQLIPRSPGNVVKTKASYQQRHLTRSDVVGIFHTILAKTRLKFANTTRSSVQDLSKYGRNKQNGRRPLVSVIFAQKDEGCRVRRCRHRKSVSPYSGQHNRTVDQVPESKRTWHLGRSYPEIPES